MSVLEQIEAVLTPHGIIPRGVVHFEAGEGPQMGGGHFARSLILLGNVGGSIWTPFTRWRDTQPDQGGINPLDNWSKAVIAPVAQALQARAYFPFEKPWWPFQQWAARAEGMRASPLGLLIHEDYGLWHGYRAALGFHEIIDAPANRMSDFPCETCADKPCLTSCPADAVSKTNFDVPACREYLATAEGQRGCMVRGCRARNACPVGAKYRYPEAQQAFHMAAL